MGAMKSMRRSAERVQQGSRRNIDSGPSLCSVMMLSKRRKPSALNGGCVNDGSRLVATTALKLEGCEFDDLARDESERGETNQGRRTSN